jgi:hypothetical protein
VAGQRHGSSNDAHMCIETHTEAINHSPMGGGEGRPRRDEGKGRYHPKHTRSKRLESMRAAAVERGCIGGPLCSERGPTKSKG